jgi:PAS domain S-box-containing protein
MQSSALPENETQRVKELQKLKILDTPPEESFDRITRLAASVFDVPIALISLIDADRQWFKSCYGMPVRESSRSISFCSHAILEAGSLVVPDALDDARFADNPLVTGPPFIRFYAGYPLRTPDGHALGTLCIIDLKPRELTMEERESLRGMAIWAQNEVNAATLHRVTSALRETEARFRGAFDNAPIGVALVSPAGQWLQVNRALCEIVGYSEQELLKITFQDITYAEDLEIDLEFVRKMLANEIRTYQLEKRYLHKRGHVVTILLSVSLVRDAANQPLYFISQIQDISERKQLDRMKSEFLATAAHELRTPMASVQGFSELLMQRDFDAEQRKELVSVIYEQSAQLTRLINELLDLARIEATGKRDFKMTPQPLMPIIQSTVAAFLPPDGRSGVEMRIDDNLPWAAVDAEKLQQALTNVLSNGYKYSPDGGQVLLTAALSVDDSHILITVRDAGIGMAPQDLERVFERFYRADAVSYIRGSGLGMTLVKEIMEVHGGNVEVRSQQGRFTEVTLSLKVAS